MFKSAVPLSVQFEVTYRCNNNCTFCYNGESIERCQHVGTEQAKKILTDIAQSGVMSLNFNGGEPLIRGDFFSLASHAKALGLSIHLNSNLTLVRDKATAVRIAEFFPAVCTSLLSGDASVHDELSGRRGAFDEVLRAIELLRDVGVYVAVNVMLCNRNAGDLLKTLELLRRLKVETVLITRYITCDLDRADLHVDDETFFEQLTVLDSYCQTHQCFRRVALPQPIKICETPAHLREFVRRSNIPCTIGLCTATVNYKGELVPCNLIRQPKLGNMPSESLETLWARFDGQKFFKHAHLSGKCLDCVDLAQCGGGCMGYNKGLSFEKRENEE